MLEIKSTHFCPKKSKHIKASNTSHHYMLLSMYDYISNQVNRVGANDQRIVKGGSYDDMIVNVLNLDGVGQDVTIILTLHDL